MKGYSTYELVSLVALSLVLRVLGRKSSWVCVCNGGERVEVRSDNFGKV